MKKKQTIKKLLASATMAIAAMAPSFAQSNLGAACGCPAVAGRPTVNLSSLATSGGANDGDLTANNTVLDCAHTYILDKKIYVPSGKSLTINPGTVIKGNTAALPADATALIVERGAKIFASGTADCPIVFTAAADPMDGTYGVTNKGQWGGLVLLGYATNNLTLANAAAGFGGTCTGSGCVGTGVGTGFIEGFIAADSRNQYGGTDDDDNSGVLKYVSVRHSGALVATGNELNGISLGSVGRGTIIDHVEVVSNDDDGFEFFGGTVNIKYASVLYSNDDMFDWDQGYTGKMQFLFGLQADATTAPTCDNGFEADTDDKKTGATPHSHPVIYNATLIGNGNINQNVGDNSAHAAINAKELTEGEIYNSVFANFETGFNMQKTFAAPRTKEAYANWAVDGTLKVKCNAFIANVEGLKTSKSGTSDGTAPLAGDLTQFNTTDLNTVDATKPGFDYTYALNTATNAVTSDKIAAAPVPALTTSCSAPADGFFNAANYKGAFKNNGESWLAGWSYPVITGPGQVACPTDVDHDGRTNTNDLLILLPNYGQNCQ